MVKISNISEERFCNVRLVIVDYIHIVKCDGKQLYKICPEDETYNWHILGSFTYHSDILDPGQRTFTPRLSVAPLTLYVLYLKHRESVTLPNVKTNVYTIQIYCIGMWKQIHELFWKLSKCTYSPKFGKMPGKFITFIDKTFGMTTHQKRDKTFFISFCYNLGI